MAGLMADLLRSTGHAVAVALPSDAWIALVVLVLAGAGVALARWLAVRRRRSPDSSETSGEAGLRLTRVQGALLGCCILGMGIFGWQIHRHWDEIDPAIRVFFHVEPSHHLARQNPAFMTEPSDGSPWEDHYLLVTSMFDDRNAMRLLDHHGRVVKEWVFDIQELFPESGLDHFTADLHGSIVLPDASVMANVEYVGVARIDADGKPVFRLSSSDVGASFNYGTHHSIDPTERGTFWVGAQNLRDEPQQFGDDILVEIDENGNVLRALSMFDIFTQNGLEIPPAGQQIEGFYSDIFHLNDIEELRSDMAEAFPMFEAGDLLFSLRQPDMIAVVDPETLELRWGAQGYWQAQHDPDFEPDGTITVFDNEGLSKTSHLRVSRILRIDPKTNAVEVQFKSPSFYSEIRGKHDLLPDGSLLVTEFSSGRVFLVDPDGKVRFEYANPRSTTRDDQTRYYEITKAELIPHSFFDPPLETHPPD